MRRLVIWIVLALGCGAASCSGHGNTCPEVPAAEGAEVAPGSQAAAPDGRHSPVATVEDTANVDLRVRTYDVLVADDLAVRGGSLGVTLVSLETPSSPRELGRFVLPNSVNGLALLRPELLAVACASEGLFVLNIADPAAPTQVAHFDTDGALWRLRSRGDDLLAADGHQGVAVLRAEASGDGVRIREIGRWASIGYVRHAEPWGDGRALVAEGREGLAALDLSDPARPRLISRVDTEGEARAVAIRGDVAFVADFHPGVVAVDVSDPEHMTFVGNLETSDSARDVIVLGDVVAVAIGTDGVVFVDAANPASMQVVSRYETALPAVRFARAGEHLAVAVDSGGMEILDVSDPAHPRQFATAR